MKQHFFQDNLKELCKNITQSEIAQKTGVSTASICGYVSGKSEPSLKFLLALKEAYDINIDDFLTQKINFDIRESPLQDAKKFLGTYIVYYYDNSVYKGKASNFSKNTLRYGVVSIYRHNGENMAIAKLMLSRQQATDLFNSIKDTNTGKELSELYGEDQLYVGNLDFTNTQVFISLKSREYNDLGLIILNNPPSNKTYIGGLGTVNSISRGREHMPCVQYILISRYVLKIPDGQIYNLLALGMADVNVKTESEQLYKLFQNLSLNAENLTEYQKLKIFEDSLSNILLDLIDANMFRFAKVSGMEDDTYYSIIREDE